MKISVSHIVTAFDCQTIGTKVTDPDGFWGALTAALRAHDFASDKIPGQGYIPLPGAVPFVSSGVGRNIDDPAAYVLRSHRGRVHAYLKREFASPVHDCAAIVYTREAYLSNPDITSGEAGRIEVEDPTHVLVAILASSGPRPALSPYRFVKNLAGGNHEALVWTAEEIRGKACEVASQVDEWSTVAD